MSSLDIIKQILDKELEMPDNRVWAYNQDADLPKDSKLFIILHYGRRHTTSNNVRYKQTTDGLQEVQTMNVAEDVIISMLSKSNEARDRAHEALLAMNSTYSKQLQEKNHIHISTTGDFWDASFLEGTSMINRFDSKVRVFKSYEKIKAVDYYDKYSFETWAENQDSDIQKDNFKTYS